MEEWRRWVLRESFTLKYLLVSSEEEEFIWKLQEQEIRMRIIFAEHDRGNGSDMEIRIILTATTEIGKLKWRTRVRCCHHNKTREFYRSIKGKDHVWRGTSLFVLIPICPLTDIEFLSGVSLFYSLAAGSPRGSSLGLFINPDVL